MSATASIAMPLRELRDKSSAIRVLTITPFFPSVQDVSQGCFIAEPIEKFAGLGIESRVIAVHPFYRSSKDASVSGSEWKAYYSLAGNLGLVTSRTGLVAALWPRVETLQRTAAFSLLHAHAALPCGEAAMVLAGRLNVPFIVSIHGLDVFAERQAGWLGLWTKRRTRQVYQCADRIVCISKQVLNALPKEAQSKGCVIHNGVDPELFSPPHTESRKPRILSVGNLITTKGHALLLRAFARVRQQIPDCELEIIGEGPERGRLFALANELGVLPRVNFRGRQDRHTIARAMRECAVFALPSRYEGLGCVYLEAMACGKPAIGCFGQGIEEIIADSKNGCLIPPNDETVLTETLTRLLKDGDLRRKLGFAARNTILQKHTLEHQARQFREVYGECLR